jgi:hypothetical protein
MQRKFDLEKRLLYTTVTQSETQIRYYNSLITANRQVCIQLFRLVAI